jgi:hypothetical protein
MRRIGLAAVLAVSLSLTPLATEAQEPKIAKIGFLSVTTPAVIGPAIEAFRQALRERGHVEGTFALEVLRRGQIRTPSGART